MDSSGSVLCAMLGLTADTFHVSVVGGFWLLFHFTVYGGPRILRSIHVQTLAFLAPRIRQSLVRCLGREGVQETLDLLGDDFGTPSAPCCWLA